jgi:centromere protein C
VKIYQKGGLREEETEDGQKVKRSARMRYKPLEYWRNEHVKFGRRKSGKVFLLC